MACGKGKTTPFYCYAWECGRSSLLQIIYIQRTKQSDLKILKHKRQCCKCFGHTLKFAGATFTLGVIFMVILFALLTYVLTHTAWGRHVYAVGDDPEAAELAGVNVKGTIISVYAVVGLICGFAAWVMIGRFGSVSPSATTGVIGNIQSITAVVIGGISLFGGRGSILGALFGALIVGVFELGLRMYGADPQWTFLLIGVLIIGATTVDQWIRKAAA